MTLARTDSPDAGSEEEASALLHVTVKDPDREKVGKAFTVPLIELGLASIPGFFATTAPPSPSAYGVYAPAWVPAEDVDQLVGLPDGGAETVPSARSRPAGAQDDEPAELVAGGGPSPGGPTRRVPLGRVVGARSGDKEGRPPSACTPGTTRATPGWPPSSPRSGCASCCPRRPACR
ncbi:hypothetical protein ACFQX8_02210 [Klenkia terrae]|uniref:acyclic terpene utilization AtuA family protein n=1 Tax=Klenkia terrae TaxID=1052259 RepID=UPI003609DCEA